VSAIAYFALFPIAFGLVMWFSAPALTEFDVSMCERFALVWELRKLFLIGYASPRQAKAAILRWNRAQAILFFILGLGLLGVALYASP
jgi:hypothetical protein